MALTLELCDQCDEPTGRAGRADDSLYLDDGRGPFCEDCYAEEAKPMKISDDHIDAELRTENVSHQIWLAVTCANVHGIEILESRSTGRLVIEWTSGEDAEAGATSSKEFTSWGALFQYVAGYHSGHCDALGVTSGGPTSCGGVVEDCKIPEDVVDDRLDG